MIQSNELRLGNKVLVDGEICTVNNLFPNNVRVEERSIYDQIEHESNYDPVPLAPDILLRCGFEEEQEDERIVYRKGFSISFKDNEFHLFIEIEDRWYSFQWMKIEFVHQLQNLFFALIGQELEVKL